MNADELLISMGRYLHAMHDIELDLASSKLNVNVKHYVEKIGPQDEILKSYWEDYVAVLTGKPIVKLDEALVSKKEPTKQVIYRGQVVNTEADEVISSSNSQNHSKEVLYRGKKV